MLDLKVLKLTIVQQNLFQQLPQFRNVPLPVADIVDPLILCICGRDLKHLVKGGIGGLHS